MTTRPSLCLHHACARAVALNGKNTNKEGGQESMEGERTHAASARAVIQVQVAQHLCIKEGTVTENKLPEFFCQKDL